jgi:hypothetical protein
MGQRQVDQRQVGWIVMALGSAAAAAAQSPKDEPPRALARSIFQELIEINTTDSVGNVTAAAEARVVADPRITIRWIDDNGQVQDKASDRKGYPPPPLKPEIMQPLAALVFHPPNTCKRGPKAFS